MKILNQTYRDLEVSPTIESTMVSELPETFELKDDSVIHVADFAKVLDNGSMEYNSMKVSVKTFKQKMYESVQNTLKTGYWDTHCSPSSTEHDNDSEVVPGSSFKAMMEYLRNQKGEDGQTVDLSPSESELHGVDGFVKHVNFDFELLRRYVVVKDLEISSKIGENNTKITEIDCQFASNMNLYTTERTSQGAIETTSSSVNYSGNDNDNYCQMHIDDGNKISNEWICPACGNLVVYGWLDTSSALNNKAIPSCYCLIEAKINSAWEIIGVQPVIPAKSITYVGFNLPVRKGLIIRARTGFTVGAKSANFSNDQDGNGTISNNVANGFKCMVFSNIEYKAESEGT